VEERVEVTILCTLRSRNKRILSRKKLFKSGRFYAMKFGAYEFAKESRRIGAELLNDWLSDAGEDDFRKKNVIE